MKHPRARVLASLSVRGELQHGSYLGEGWWRPHHGDERGLLDEFVAKADDDDVDELRVADDVTKFTELVADGFDALVVEVDRGVALGHVAQLGVQNVLPSVAVALEKLAHGSPDLGGGGVFVVEGVEDFGGDPEIGRASCRERVYVLV